MSFPYTFQSIASGVIHGITQAIKVVIPLVQPEMERGSPPTWWYWFWSWGDWYLNLDANKRPSFDWCYHWTAGNLRLIGRYAESLADDAVDKASDAVLRAVGRARHGFQSFGDWIDNIWSKVGSVNLPWAGSLTAAATWLRDRLPQQIRYGWSTWEGIWSDIKQGAIDWARARYEDGRAWAHGAYSWVLSVGETLKAFYDRSRAWVDDWRQNAHTRVLGILGNTWNQLTTFARGPLTFWSNLWGSHANEIGAFFGNPLLYLYDKAEDFLCSRW